LLFGTAFLTSALAELPDAVQIRPDPFDKLRLIDASPTWPNSRLASASLQWRKVFDRVFGLTVALDHVDLSRPRSGGGDDGWRDTQARVQFDAWLH
jgi:hypothetical protein